MWQALAFAPTGPHLFRYSYESDGTTATMLAVGDLDCDGTEIAYRLEAALVDGRATLTITPPAPDTD